MSEPSGGASSGLGRVFQAASRFSAFTEAKRLRHDRVVLSTKEAALFGRLRQVCAHHKLKTQIRVAGGWVRDKLLGLPSDDIDLALDDITGARFAQHVNDYLKESGERVRGIGIIKCNPEQSKHLETATFVMNDYSIDANNLRTETYGESRIPNMEIGTPEQDAERRDFTVNALFYNITACADEKTGQYGVVEDFTKRGMSDLKQGVLRTPLDPVRTFVDDPLRVLRAARFAGRFCFAPVADIHQAASIPYIHQCIVDKVARERVWAEVSKMYKCQHAINAAQSIHLLHDWGILPLLLQLPKPSEGDIDQKLPFLVSLPPVAFNLRGSTVLESLRHCGSPLLVAREHLAEEKSQDSSSSETSSDPSDEGPSELVLLRAPWAGQVRWGASTCADEAGGDGAGGSQSSSSGDPKTAGTEQGSLNTDLSQGEGKTMRIPDVDPASVLPQRPLHLAVARMSMASLYNVAWNLLEATCKTDNGAGEQKQDSPGTGDERRQQATLSHKRRRIGLRSAVIADAEQQLLTDTAARASVLLAASLLPLHGVGYCTYNLKKRSVPGGYSPPAEGSAGFREDPFPMPEGQNYGIVLDHVILQHLKAPKAVAKRVSTLLNATIAFASMCHVVRAGGGVQNFSALRDLKADIGHVLSCVKEDYPQALILLLQNAAHYERQFRVLDGPKDSTLPGFAETVEEFADWLCEESGLHGSWAWGKLINGKDVQTLGKQLSTPIKGKSIGVWVSRARDWRFQQPGMTKEQCLNRIAEELNAEKKGAP